MESYKNTVLVQEKAKKKRKGGKNETENKYQDGRFKSSNINNHIKYQCLNT